MRAKIKTHSMNHPGSVRAALEPGQPRYIGDVRQYCRLWHEPPFRASSDSQPGESTLRVPSSRHPCNRAFGAALRFVVFASQQAGAFRSRPDPYSSHSIDHSNRNHPSPSLSLFKCNDAYQKRLYAGAHGATGWSPACHPETSLAR